MVHIGQRCSGGVKGSLVGGFIQKQCQRKGLGLLFFLFYCFFEKRDNVIFVVVAFLRLWG